MSFKVRFLSFFSFTLLLSFFLSGAVKNLKGEKVVVESNVSFSDLYGLTNVIEIFPENTEFTTLGDLLKDVGLIDVGDRSGDGVYGDIRMRGSSFSEVLICIDGIPLYNYHTAHLNLTLPINLNMVKKIEVVPGPIGTLFGGNVIGGVINIITKGYEKDGGSFSLFTGSYDFFNFNSFVSKKFDESTLLTSFCSKKRGAFIFDRDYRTDDFNLFYNFKGENYTFYSKFLINRREVGENNFFAKFPSYENVKNYDALFSLESGKSRFDFAYYKSDDEFLLIRGNPQFYKNLNIGKNYLFKYTGTDLYKKFYFRYSLGFERHEIDSNRLNFHSFNNLGVALFFSYNLFQNFKLNFSGRFDYFSKFKNKFLKGTGFIYKFSKINKISLSYSEGYRVPSFVELYYDSPSNVGNSVLNPEESKGIDFSYLRNGRFNLRFSLFYRRDKNLIDWVWRGNFWHAENISKVKVYGEEVGIGKDFERITLNLSFSHIDEDFSNYGETLKYGREFLKNKLILSFKYKPFRNLFLDGGVIFNHRSYGNKFFPVRFTLDRKFKDNFHFFVKVDNLLNEGYESFKGIRSPGRSLKIGFRRNFK